MELLQLCLAWATLAASLLYLLITTTKLGRRSRSAGTAAALPPGPRPVPILGNLLDVRHGSLHHTLARLARTYGPVMYLRLGFAATVVISSRDAAGEALRKHDRRLAARAVPDIARAHDFSGRSMMWLPSSHPRWKALRTLVGTHIFSARNLAAARGVRERKVRDLVGFLRARSGKEVDVGQAIYGGVLNLMSTTFFSVDLLDPGADSTQGLRKLMKELVSASSMVNVSDLFPFLRPIDLQGRRRWTATRLTKVFRYLDDIIDRRYLQQQQQQQQEPQQEQKNDFLGVLLELMSTGKIARRDITTILFEFFIAGSDTMVITVEWTVAELLRNPGVMAKVRAEIEDAVGGPVQESDAVGLRYLGAVVKETMRLHPAAPLLLPHLAMDDGIEIGGHRIPKGCTVMFNAWAIMRDPAAWERPDEFIPERFLDRAEAMDYRGKDVEFIPFGSGLRLCPAVSLSERVVPHVVASLVQAFDWRLTVDELDLTEKFTTTNILGVPLMAVPVAIA